MQYILPKYYDCNCGAIARERNICYNTAMKEFRLQYGAAADRRMVNPEEFGISCVAQLGVSRFRQAYPPVEEHIHRDMAEIGFCLRDPLAINVLGCEYPVMPGEFFVSQPNVPHHLTTRPAGIFLYYFLLRKPTRGKTLFDLPVQESAEIWRRLSRLPPTVSANARAARAGRMFAALFQLFDMKKSAWVCVKMRRLFLSLVVLLLECAERGGEKADLSRVAHTAEMIRSRPEQPFTVQELAAEADLSPTHFINLFRQATGFPPIKFQIQCRVERAKAMLRETSMPIVDVAMRLGFGSHQHFSDTFSRIVGMSPKQWRANAFS